MQLFDDLCFAHADYECNTIITSTHTTITISHTTIKPILLNITFTKLLKKNRLTKPLHYILDA